MNEISSCGQSFLSPLLTVATGSLGFKEAAMESWPSESAVEIETASNRQDLSLNPSLFDAFDNRSEDKNKLSNKLDSNDQSW